jgi:transmembrane sensor
MTQDRHEHLILKSLSGSLTPEEGQELRLWLDENPENRLLLEEYRKVWQLSNRPDELPDFQTRQEWQKLESAIQQDRAAAARPHPVPSRRSPLLAIAASLAFLILCAVGLYLFSLDGNRAVIVKESGEEMIEFVLPDGSEVWLNRHSRLTYQQGFNEQERRVELSGEAFF